jgi:hypothetical protein
MPREGALPLNVSAIVRYRASPFCLLVVPDSAQNLDTNPELRQTSEAIVLEDRKPARGKRLHLKALVTDSCLSQFPKVWAATCDRESESFVNLASSDAL